MKAKSLFYAFGVGAVLASCSSEEVMNPGDPQEPANLNSKYVSVSIVTPVGMGTKGDVPVEGDYENGLDAENKVEKAAFFFFDSNDNCVDIQVLTKTDFKAQETNLNPAVSNVGEAELTLKEGIDYKQVVVVLNPSESGLANLKTDITDVTSLRGTNKNYAGNIKTDDSGNATGGFTMSNSVFYNTSKAEDIPQAGQLYFKVPIDNNNIYTSADKTSYGTNLFVTGEGNGNKEKVEIFVERIVSKIKVNSYDAVTGYYANTSGDGGKIDVTGDNDLSSQITIKPVIKGMAICVTAPRANLIKTLTLTQVGYNQGGENYQNFRWNDPQNKRSYWASTTDFDKTELGYQTYSSVSGKNATGNFTEYVNPNTLDYTTNESSTRSTKLVVVAELQSNGKAIDLVKYGTEYLLASALKTRVANRVRNDIKAIDVTTIAGVTDENKEAVENAVTNFHNSIDNTAIDLGVKGTKQFKKDKDGKATATVAYVENAYEAVVSFGKTVNIVGITSETLKSAIETKLNTVITDAITQMNNPQIEYWKNGQTYYYTSIRHQGFFGLTGEGSNYLNAIVRNHVYNVTITGLYGLGTAVPDENLPINPERPGLIPAKYMTAQIKVLKWRIVNNNVTVH